HKVYDIRISISLTLRPNQNRLHLEILVFARENVIVMPGKVRCGEGWKMHLTGLMVPKGKKKFKTKRRGACARMRRRSRGIDGTLETRCEGNREMSDPIHDNSGTSKFGDDFGCQHDVRRKLNPQRNRRNSLDQICGMCQSISPVRITCPISRSRCFLHVVSLSCYDTSRLRLIGINRDTLVHSSTSAIGPSKTEIGKCKSRVNQESHQVFNNVNT
ncbi:6071_t:CDS:2, partial [Acaulospora morrowiae]